MAEYETDWVLCPSPGCLFDAVLNGRQALPSTDGYVDHGTVSCAAGHQFFMPSDRLIRVGHPAQQPAHGSFRLG